MNTTIPSTESKPGHAPRSPLLFLLSETPCSITGLEPERLLQPEVAQFCSVAQGILQKTFARFFNIPPAPAPFVKPGVVQTEYFSDAALLLFPVRTLRNSFTWVTSVDRIDAFLKTCKNCACVPRWKLPPVPAGVALIGPRNHCVARKQVIVEQFGFPAEASDLIPGISHWLADQVFPWGPEYQLWKRKLAQDLVILPEVSLCTVMATCLPGSAGIGDQTSAIARPFKWSLPADCIFYSVMAPDLWDRKFESTHTVLQGENLDAPAVFGVRIVRHAKRRRKKVTLRKDQTAKAQTAKTEAPAAAEPPAAAAEPPKEQ